MASIFLVNSSFNFIGSSESSNKPKPEFSLTKEAFITDLKIRTFNYFWQVVDSATWQSDDRYPTRHFTSIAATGFALPAYIIGVENG